MNKSEFVNNTLDILKLILGVLLLVVVGAITLSFSNQISSLDSSIISSFIAGIVSLLVIFIFIWSPYILYKKGQHILEVCFNFFAPILKTASYTLPIYTIFIFIGYVLVFYFNKSEKLLLYAIFLMGFSLCFHLVFTGIMLRPRNIELKRIANYIFGFCIIYIINIILCAWFFSLMKINFAFQDFFTSTLNISKNIYSAVFVQLFSVSN